MEAQPEHQSCHSCAVPIINLCSSEDDTDGSDMVGKKSGKALLREEGEDELLFLLAL
jgi:hypothetical protein